MAIRVPRLTLSRHGVFRFRYVRPAEGPQPVGRREICISLRTRNLAEARNIALFLNHIIEAKLANEIDPEFLRSIVAHAHQFTLKIGRMAVEVKNKDDAELLQETLKDPANELGQMMREAAQQESCYIVQALEEGVRQGLLENSQRAQPSISIQAAIELFVDSLPGTGNSPATVKYKRTRLRAFRDWLVHSGDIVEPGYPHEVNGSHVGLWFNHYQKVGAKGLNTGPKTGAALLTLLEDFFQHCIALQLCTVNPVTGYGKLKTKAIRQARAERRPYKPLKQEMLPQIFNPELYFTCMSAADMFFGPLMAIFTGARREEIAALKESDFEQAKLSDGSTIWVFRIRSRADDGRRLKNHNSERVVPVCEALIEAGLIEYLLHVRSLKLTTDSALDLFPAREGAKKGNKLGERFGVYLTRLGLKTGERSECFHSLRHTVITYLLGLGVPPQVSMKIVGHLGQSDLEKYGFSGEQALFSTSVHHTTYDSSSDLHHTRLASMEQAKRALDRLNSVYQIQTRELGAKAKQVIALTKRLRNGDFVSGSRAPNSKSLLKKFPDLNLAVVERNR